MGAKSLVGPHPALSRLPPRLGPGAKLGAVTPPPSPGVGRSAQ